MPEENSNKISLLQKAIADAQANLDYAKQLLVELSPEELSEIERRAQEKSKFEVEGETKIVEGVFDGQNMIGPQDQVYNVPANYASKSKLVEGDLLKLTIIPDGSFIYKQIGPVSRKRIVGALLKDDDNNWKVLVDGVSFKVNSAAVSYFKGEPGDEVIVLIPQKGTARFAAVENIVKALTPQEKEELLTSGAEAELPNP